MKKVNIDEKACTKHNLSFDEVLVALVYRNVESPSSVLSELLSKEVLVKKEGKYLITQHWNDIIEEVLCDSTTVKDEDAQLKELAEKMRELFPQGKMHNTPYYYRCNNAEVVRKLKKFFKQYGRYSDEDILDATKRFIASFHGQYRYLPLIKYFISKLKSVEDEDGHVHNVEHSPLADYLENKEEGVTTVDNPDEWMMNVKN